MLLPIPVNSGPDYLLEYPPAFLNPTKHEKLDKTKLPPLDGPGNLGSEKDWQIPEKYEDNGNYEQYRSFDILAEPNFDNVGNLVFIVLVTSIPGSEVQIVFEF